MTTPLSPAEQTAAAKEFASFWQGKGYEKGQTQPFWLDLLRLLGVENPSAFIEFEDAARMDEAHGFIDAFIPSTHVLVEQKSLGRDLRAPIRQSDGTFLTPFQQARRYSASLPYSQRPRWIVTCNFAEFHVYDMENPNAEPESIRLADLPNDLYRLRFLVNAASDRVAREMEVSIEAGRIVGRIYDALLAQYGEPTPEVLHWLNVLCVRLVFCLYAEDAGIFADDQFHDYLATIPTHRLRQALLDLFATLDTKPEERSRYLDPGLAAFPYVNGSLFAGPVEIPQFTEDLRAALLEKASLGFDWSEISPTIFGAVFESTLNPETRRSGGMHYTSIENIHKVIDPLFLAALRTELDAALEIAVPRQRDAALLAFQQKLGSLTFLDPACGSGNFLTETYLSLRRLENQAIAARYKGQGVLGVVENPICVSIRQFHGIEINDFAVSVAKTALWIADSQMLAETAQIVRLPLHFLPLESYDGIVEGNALRMDWRELCSSPSMRVEKSNVEKLKSTADLSTSQPFNLSTGFDYIMGNPPFVGARLMSPDQKADLAAVFGPDWRNLGNLDYVSGWYKKAADLMAANPSTRTALVSTNSVCQGEAPAVLWKPLVASGIAIDFAHRTFRWDSESTDKAHVHCVIVGFSCPGGASPGGPGGPPAKLPPAPPAGEPPAPPELPAPPGPPAPPGSKTYPEGWHNRHYLPHAEYRRLQFVTYRLFDSLPADVVLRWKDELRITDATAPDSPEAAELRRRIEQFEDAGHGSCFLRDPRIAALVRDNLQHFDGDRYRLLDWCIMPNHVHVLLEVAEGQTLSGILHSWRSWTAHEANKLLGRTGPFWQTEYFDRFIRDAEHLRKTIAYIDDNPSKANLRDWPWKAPPGGAGGPPANSLPPAPSAGGPPAPPAPASKPLYDGPRHTLVPHINPYLLPAPDVFLESRRVAISAPRPLVFGSMPNDGGHLSDWSPERRADLLARYPQAAPLFRRITGSHEYINGVERWCLWLKDAAPALLRSVPPVMEAIEAVRALRLASKREATRRLADTPTLFGEIRQPESGDYIAIPKVSSERRRYIPMGFLSSDTIASDLIFLVPSATLYHFGILTSNVHMSWMRAVCGRLKSDYRYSANIVYNNFPWPGGASPGGAGGPPANSAGEPPAPPAWATRIAATARAILDARAAHPGATLADLYDPLTMPPDLLAAHRANDRAVMSAYGFDLKMAESDCVAELFKLYQSLATSQQGKGPTP